MPSLASPDGNGKAQSPEEMFKRKGIRMHRGIAANAIGARTPSQQLTDASKAALQNDPVVGGALPQNRIGRYTDLNNMGQGA